jgi:hypothetical protein
MASNYQLNKKMNNVLYGIFQVMRISEMRKLFLFMAIFLLFPAIANAIWQFADPTHGASYQHIIPPRFGKLEDYPQKYYNDSMVLLQLRKGSLKDNVSRLAKKYRWLVVWHVTRKYYVLLNTDIVGPTFPVAMNRLLVHYPVHAKYDRRYFTVTVYD